MPFVITGATVAAVIAITVVIAIGVNYRRLECWCFIGQATKLKFHQGTVH